MDLVLVLGGLYLGLKEGLFMWEKSHELDTHGCPRKWMDMYDSNFQDSCLLIIKLQPISNRFQIN